MTEHSAAHGGAHEVEHRQSRLHRTQDDRDLSALMIAWAEQQFPGDKVTPDFIRDEFEGRLRGYRWWARTWRVAQVAIWLLVAVLGLLITVFAGYKIGHGFTIVAGALIAMLTTFSNATHPAQKADGYLNGRLGLRDEGWSLLTRTGDYAGLADPKATFDHFADTVHKIVVTKRQNTDLDGLVPSGH